MGNSPEEQRQDKVGTFYILLYSLLIDIFWCLFWGGKWDNIATIAHELTLFFSWCGIVLKILTILIIGFMELDAIKFSVLHLLKQKSSSGKENFMAFEED